MPQITAPYHFVPVVPELAVHDAPVFHDVQQTGVDSWSGELLCELEALTPLIAGHYQFEFENATQSLQDAFRQLATNRGAPAGDVAADKKIIEPFTVTSPDATVPDHVLIPGTQLKGMLRQSLQALLAAPMERVAERTFSYRPNLMNAINVRPAIVTQRLPANGSIQSLEVRFVSTTPEVVYVRQTAEATLESWLRTKGTLQPTQNLSDLAISAPIATFSAGISGIEIQVDGFAKKLSLNARTTAPLTNYLLTRYRGGLDGRSTFASAHNDGNPANAYSWALIPNSMSPSSIMIPDPVLRQYVATLRHLADKDAGHLSKHPKHSTELSAMRNQPLDRVVPDSTMPEFLRVAPQVGDLVFVEFKPGTSNKGRPEDIISIGHHFRYRWMYRDSIHNDFDPVRTKSRSDRSDQQRIKQMQAGNLRAVLCPTPLEVPPKADKSGDHQRLLKPQKLSAARGLFGFVGTKSYSSTEPTSFGIAPEKDGNDPNDFHQLAGRIAINWAVEEVGERKVEERFLNPQDQYLVPLRPLGSPKASAVEVYLSQTSPRSSGGTLKTYGDDLGDPASGELNGRKFYLHQPKVRAKPDATEPRFFELCKKNVDWENRSEARITYHILMGQAPIVRFVSKEQTKFRFSIRFRDLRPWELGAILFVLNSDELLVKHLAEEIGATTPDSKIKRWLSKVPKGHLNERTPLLALKLGHGRPLGLGSVRVRVLELHRLMFASTDSSQPKNLWPTVAETKERNDLIEVTKSLVTALADKLKPASSPNADRNLRRWADDVLYAWLQVHKFAGREVHDYPRGENGDDRTRPIFDYHSAERKEHAKARKFAKGGQPVPSGLKPIDELR
ncbi:MAG: TIGR03986 family CRISPR-associated RAMP protein [Planctomycetaceae bacterium]